MLLVNPLPKMNENNHIALRELRALRRRTRRYNINHKLRNQGIEVQARSRKIISPVGPATRIATKYIRALLLEYDYYIENKLF